MEPAAITGAGATLAAAAPILLVLGLMLGLHWSAARAGAAGLGVALLVSGALSDLPALALAGIAAEGAFLSATILWILWPALALHQHQQRSGALDTVRAALERLAARPFLQVLLVGWFLALFFEGAAGFGTPVALAAPLLAGLGMPPLRAVTVALLGHAVGVSFGALGTPVLAQVALTGLEPLALAWRTALLHTLTGWLMMVFFVRAAQAGALSGGDVAWAAFAAAAFLLPSLALAAWLGPELPTLGGALLGGALFAWALRARGGRTGPAAQGSLRPLLRAAAPYAVLVLLVLATRAVPPLATAVVSVALEWRWMERFSGRWQPLAHPGTLLFLALVLGAVAQGVPLRTLTTPLAAAARLLLPVSLALLAMLCLSRLMLHGGLIAVLERAAVEAVGPAWPWLAPAVGALGSFVTGSATAANVLFTTLQAQMAQALGLPAAWIVAAQNFGAAVGNIVCPHNIVAGAAAVQAGGREAEILRRTLLPCAAYLLLGGAVLVLLLRIAPSGGP